MKNILLWVYLTLLPVCGSAQTSQEVLQHFLEKMTAGPVEMSFKFTYDNEPKKVHDLQIGILLYDGKQYHLQLGDLDVYCDGINKWVYNEAVEEVTILPVEETAEMTDNPLAYLIYNGDKFNYRPVKQVVLQGEQVFSVDLIPKNRDAAYTMVNLQVEKETFLPVQLSYKMRDGQSYTIDVNSFNTDVTVKAFGFSFPSHLYPGVVINDMR
jgi:outer membrane lipoprotein-sorting protein